MWPRLATALVGLWLMAAPAILGYGGPAATNDHIVGPLVVSFAIVSMSAVTRSLRWLSVPLGVWLLAAPFLLVYEQLSTIHSLAIGVLLIGLAPLGGRVEERFGGGWSMLWSRNGGRDSNVLQTRR